MQVLILHYEKNVKKNAINCCLFRHKMREAIWLALRTFRQWSRNVCNSDQTVFWLPTHSLARETIKCLTSKEINVYTNTWHINTKHTITRQQRSNHSKQSLAKKILLEDEIDLLAAKTKILLQVDLEILTSSWMKLTHFRKAANESGK